jgi:DNA-binding transcriptional LysR family regulator
MNNLPSVELELLSSYALFALVVKHGSFSEAARLSGMARSAVSQRIRRLERHHRGELLRRTTRRVTATEAGAALYEQCARLLEHAEGLSRALDDNKLSGSLRVNAPLSMVDACLRRLLVQLVHRHSGLTIDLVLENRAIDLLESRDEVVIRVGRTVAPDAVARRLAQIQLVAAASPGYLRRAGEPIHPRELVHHRCLRYGIVPTRQEWRFDGGQHVVAIDGPFIASDGGVLKDLALDDQGLIVVPEYMVANEVNEGRLRIVLQDHALETLTCWAITPARRSASHRARLLVDFLARNLNAALPRLTH